MMSVTNPQTIPSVICVVTVGLDPEAAEQVQQAVLVQKATFLGRVRDYSVQTEASLLSRLQLAPLSVCIVDFDKDRDLAAQAVTTIRSILRGRSTVIAASHETEGNRILDAMRAGCGEYLVKPFSVEDLCKALTRVQGQFHEAVPPSSDGKIISLLGCRGGVGTTALVVHLATFLGQICNRKALIVDGQPSLGHVSLYMGEDQAQYDFYELVQNVARLDQELLSGYVLHHKTGTDVLASRQYLNGQVHVSLPGIGQTLGFLRGVYDIVIVDCPRGLTDLTLAIMESCDQVYLVATPEVAALRDLSRHLERLSQYAISKDKIRAVINKSSSDSTLTVEQIEKSIGRPVSIRIPDGGTELIRAVNAGAPLSPNRRSEFANQIRKWACDMAPPAPVEEERKRKFLLWR